jgi:minor extracellular serine protease Vpr
MSRLSFSRVAPLAAAALIALGAASASAQTTLASEQSESRRLWFVELSSAPLADGGSASTLRAEKNAFRRAAAAAGLRYTERKSFDTLFNGFSVEVNLRDRAKLATLPGVKAMYPVELIQAPTMELGAGAAPDLATALTMTGASVAQNTLGLTGAGVKVAVMDTGIDIDHPDFGGSGVNGTTPFPNNRITHGYDFVGDAFNADPSSASYNPNPTPDARPDDCGGHGTHVAGIVGANGTAKGVAPGASLGAYRVFGCAGSTTSDIMIEAMERALADGMHVLNMSIGASFQWPQYPTAQAATRLVNKGMVVVTSIGNSGASGLYTASAPGVGQKVIGTASFDNLVATLPAFTVTPGGELIGFNRASGAPVAPASGSLPMSRTGTTASTADACSPLPAGSLAGTAVLIRRGTCGFYVKAFNAQSAGAAAVVLYNNAAGELNPTVAGTPPITIPVVAVNAVNGALLDGRIAAGPTTLTWGTGSVSSAQATGGLISSFSSYGMAPDLTLKPDIGAPGGAIFSTVPLELGAYGSNSGTSMASPHVAGSVALLLQARPKTNAQDVRAILQNHADPKAWWGNPGLGFLDNVHRQGAGMLDVVGAVTGTTRVEPSKIAAGESQSGPYPQTLTIRNSGASPVTYHLSSVNALSTGANTFTPTFSLSDASVAFSAPSVVVPANGSATVTATITPASAPAGGVYGGYVVLTDAADAAKSLRVPFAGYVGDYQARAVLTGGFPYLGRLTACTILLGDECALGGSFAVFPGGNAYTMADAFNLPNLLVHLDHQVRRLRVEVFDAASGAAMGRIVDDEYVGRNSTATGFFAYPWDGTTFRGNGKNANQWAALPNGSYVARLSVLKALGDSADPTHWESWTSPVITIARP